MTILVRHDYKNGAGDTVVRTSGYRFAAQQDANFTNRGSVTIMQRPDADAVQLVGLYSDGSAPYAHSLIWNRVGATFEVHASGSFAQAFGYVADGAGPDFLNEGSFRVVADNQSAWGVLDSSPDARVTNSGDLYVRGGRAWAVTISSDRAEFHNTGTITAHADQDLSYAVVLSGQEAFATNGGEIIAESFQSVALSLNGFMFNTGLIRGELAAVMASAADAQVDLVNRAQVQGAVISFDRDDEVNNSGQIVGEIRLGAGDDAYEGANGRHTGALDGGAGDDRLIAGADDDLIWGDHLENRPANGGADRLDGGGGADTLSGDGGADTLIGGLGADTLIGGVARDVFLYYTLSDTAADAPDLITDLQSIDVIDVAFLDSDGTRATDGPFKLVGHFHDRPAEMMLSYDAATDRTSVLMDTDGDGQANAVILLAGDQSGFTHFNL